MNMDIRFLELISQVFRYPSAGLKGPLSELEAYCAKTNPSYAGKTGLAGKEADKFSLTGLEEIYADLFYIKPLISLDVGFQLFGDERKRVEFLLHLKGLQQRYAVNCGSELPDSLPNILTLLTRMEAGGDRDELINLALVPALVKMVSIMAEAKKERSEAAQPGENRKGVRERETKDRKRRISRGIPVYLPLLELLLEFVKNAAPGAEVGK